MERVRVPPTLLRIPPLPAKASPKKLKLLARLFPSDFVNGKILHSLPAKTITLENATKAHSKNAFDAVLGPEITQEEVSAAVLPDLLHSVFGGVDACLLAFGGHSKGKQSCLYDPGPPPLGLFQSALNWTFRLVDEYKLKKPEYRFSVRISALYFSQRDNQLIDLFGQFNPDPRRHDVRVVDDPATGTHVQFESELRVDSPEQALFYLATAIDHRLVDDEDSHRARHLFFSIVLYGFRSGPDGVEAGGKSRLAMVDLGLGERNSQKGELTMPAIGNMLLALCQGQKYLPSKENILCRLLKIALAPSKNTVLMCTFTDRADDNENMLQLVSKIARAKRTSRRVKPMGDGSSLSSGTSRRGPRSSEPESSSEQSGAETVIFMGATVRPSSSPSNLLPRPASQSSGHSNNTLVSTGSSGNRTLTSIPPLLKNHTPFFSPVSRLYDDLCSPSTSTAPLPFYNAKFDGETLEPFVSPDHSPRRSKSRQGLDEEKRAAIFAWMDGHEAEKADTGTQCDDDFDDDDDELEDERTPSIPKRLEHPQMPPVPTYSLKRTSSEHNAEQLEIPPANIMLSVFLYDLLRNFGDRESFLPQRPPLEDIIEMDEESLKSSIRSMKKSQLNGLINNNNNTYSSLQRREREALASKDIFDHPLSILSREGLNEISSNNDEPFKTDSERDEDLERMMAASVGSMRSHEILSKVVKELQRDSFQTGSGTASEMDLYRRASQLEGYAAERVKELDEEKKRKKQKLLLNCCQKQGSMTSSSSTVNWEQIERRRERDEEKRRKDELRKRREELKAEEQELRRQRVEIDRRLEEHTPFIPPIAQSIARQITNQLQRFNLGTSPHRRPPRPPLHPSDSLPSTPSVSHRKFAPTDVSSTIPRAPSLTSFEELTTRENDRLRNRQQQLVFQPLAPRTHSSSHLRHPTLRRESKESRKNSKTRSRERRSSDSQPKEDLSLKSPYSKVTEARKESNCGSSGRGSDDNASGIAAQPNSLKRTPSYRNRNRDSYSASSGYESASADYHRFSGKDRLRMLPKRSTSAIREVEQLREDQRRLRRELAAAQERIGQPSTESSWSRSHELSLASPATVVDTLTQENRILEKRLLACQSHTMIVTAFL